MGERNESGALRLPQAADFAATGHIDQLHGLLAQSGMNPGWNKPEPSLWPAPRKTFVPARWQYALGRAALAAAGRFVSTELAERRNLILFNPSPGNTYATARTMVAAYQMVMPHEVARSHRHTPNALRLVLEAAPGTYTVVQGERVPMLPGDVLLTPAWHWHGHDNQSDGCAYWIDVLDAPLVQLLEPMFFEHYPGGIEPVAPVNPGSPMRFAFAGIQERLARTAPTADGVRELKLGPPQMDTLELSVLALDAKACHAPPRSTANALYAVMAGAGEASVEGSPFSLARGDVLVVPAWRAVRLESATGLHLLRVGDDPVMRKLGWLRTE
jgi:gentisate 1,2-dioxygenase